MKIFLIIVGVLVVLIALLMSLSATLTLIYDGGWHTSVQVLFIKKDIVLSQILSFILFPEKSAEQAKKKGKDKKENKKDTTEPTPENAPTEDEKATQAVPEKSESEKAPAKAEEKPKKPLLFCGGYAKILFAMPRHCLMRKCWNRQTGTFEVRVSMTCGFKSHLPHQPKER